MGSILEFLTDHRDLTPQARAIAHVSSGLCSAPFP